MIFKVTLSSVWVLYSLCVLVALLWRYLQSWFASGGLKGPAPSSHIVVSISSGLLGSRVMASGILPDGSNQSSLHTPSIASDLYQNCIHFQVNSPNQKP
ncbi:hypothetical protein CEXT_271251 [Caerostris extrusa]|uniref:Uncharacterized protein n=1 Tax=Caerostris extrusa TaxID=172846 RepID=A0AAV4UI16_CAEEX|nr:hypothetical protein CEXT_271251 [Caerostris extrusa]